MREVELINRNGRWLHLSCQQLDRCENTRPEMKQPTWQEAEGVQSTVSRVDKAENWGTVADYRYFQIVMI